MSAVEIRGLSFRYPDGTFALNDINLCVAHNQKLALLGANGSGKTTLMMHLNGLNLPQTGTVTVFGEEVNEKNLRSIRRKAGILFDNPDNQLFSTTVYDDVAFGPFNMGYSEQEIRTRATAAIERVGMDKLARRPPHNLSLGEKKKAAIAGLLSMDLQLFVMDEPFSGLDPASFNELRGILEQLHEMGATLIISTHDVDFAYAWADAVAVIGGGQIQAFGTTEILENEEHCRTWRLNTPVLYEVFSDTAVRPKNPAQARGYLNSFKNK